MEDKKVLSWKFVLCSHARIGAISKMGHYATMLNYPYFMWYDVIYDTRTGKRTKYTVQ